MSDGLNNMAGRPTVTREFNGKTYHFRTIVLGEHAEKETYIQSLKPNPLEVLAKIPPTVAQNVRRSIEDAALRAATVPQFVTREQESQFDESLHGLAWGLWRSLRDLNEDFGKRVSTAPPKHITPLGIEYDMTPTEGVQRCLDLIEELGNKHFADLVAIRDGVVQKDIVGN